MATQPNFGDKIATIQWTFGRSEESPNDTNVSQQVNCSDIEEITTETEYGIEMKPYSTKNRPFTDPVRFTTTTQTNRKRFTTPYQIVKDTNLKPGHTVYFSLYELDQKQEELLTDGDVNELPDEQLTEMLSDAMSNIDKAQSQIEIVRGALQKDSD